jgi:hypothetical protein
MASGRLVAAVLSGLSLGACALPTPDYKVMQYPVPYRKEADGAILDNEGFQLDAEGYRIDKQNRRIDVVDVPARTAGESSNAVAGYYISSQGGTARGNVMTPSVGGTSGAGFGPGSANPMAPPTATPDPTPATGQPVPLGSTSPMR